MNLVHCMVSLALTDLSVNMPKAAGTLPSIDAVCRCCIVAYTSNEVVLQLDRYDSSGDCAVSVRGGADSVNGIRRDVV